eukprot:848345-Prorocentrum_minimum.AAC.2
MACREGAYTRIRGQCRVGRGHIPGSGVNGVWGGGNITVWGNASASAAMRHAHVLVPSHQAVNFDVKLPYKRISKRTKRLGSLEARH